MSGIFEGRQDGQKFFSHDLSKLEEGQYKLAGQLVAMSIAQDGHGLHILNECLFNLMVGSPTDLQRFDLDLLPDYQSSDILKEVL
ncbi:MAG: hypothetical protein ABW168_28855 [Sedimenticola sp.]